MPATSVGASGTVSEAMIVSAAAAGEATTVVEATREMIFTAEGKASPADAAPGNAPLALELKAVEEALKSDAK